MSGDTPAKETKTAKSGIVTNEQGERHIPSSTRADGSVRKEIKVRPGYRPQEDVELFRSKLADRAKQRTLNTNVPVAEPAMPPPTSFSKRHTRSQSSRGPIGSRPAFVAAQQIMPPTRSGHSRALSMDPSARGSHTSSAAVSVAREIKPPAEVMAETLDIAASREVERDREARKLLKKLRQARELNTKREDGHSLLPEQLAKAVKIKELLFSLEKLGLNSDGQPLESQEANLAIQ